MSELYSCSRGFLIERHDDGTYTPFFIKVRMEDIVDYEGGGITPGGGGGTTENGVSIVESGGWIVRKYTSNFFEATKSIDVSANYFTKTSGTDSELTAIVSLPLASDEDNLCVNITLGAQNDAIATAIASCTPVISNNRVLSLKITLRNLAYTFPNEWPSDETYVSSKVYIRVSGK